VSVPSREVREIIKKLAPQGWRVEQRSTYYLAFPPDENIPPVRLPTSRGESRWRQNLIAALRRAGADL
jgi:hypothetical protein